MDRNSRIMNNENLDHNAITQAYSDLNKEFAFIDKLVFKHLLYFCLFGDSKIVHDFGCKYGVFNTESMNSESNLNLAFILLNPYPQLSGNRKSIIYFFDVVSRSLQNFDLKNNSEKDISALLTNIVKYILKTNRLYSWENNSINEYIFEPLEYRHPRKKVPRKIYNISFKNDNYIEIDGYEGKVCCAKFLKSPKRTKKSLFDRYISFYSDINKLLWKPKGEYCNICNPNGLKPKKNGKETFNQHCKGCKKVFEEVAKIFSDADCKKSIKRIKDNVVKAQGVSIQEIKNNRIVAFRKSLSREIKKLKKENLKKYKMLRKRNILTSKNLKNIAIMMQERLK